MTKGITIIMPPSAIRLSGSADVFIGCRDVIAKEIAAKKSPKEIIEQASKELPELKVLLADLPRRRRDAYDFITILLSVINSVILLYSALKPTEIKQIIINQTIQNYFYLKQPTKNPLPAVSQHESHIGRKQRQYSKKRNPLPKEGHKTKL